MSRIITGSSAIKSRRATLEFSLSVAAFGRDSRAHYDPDNVAATLNYNNGVATAEDRILYSFGVQADASYELGDKHTIRGGFMATQEYVTADSTTHSSCFPWIPNHGAMPLDHKKPSTSRTRATRIV